MLQQQQQQNNAFLFDSISSSNNNNLNNIIQTNTSTAIQNQHTSTIQQQQQNQQQQLISRRQHQPNIKTQQLANGDSRVIRSEVWNCFDLDGLNAVCRACNERLKVGPTRQTSSLWRHLKRHSREVQDRLVRQWAEAGLSSRSANRMVARLQQNGSGGTSSSSTTTQNNIYGNQQRRRINNYPYLNNIVSSSSSDFIQRGNDINLSSFNDSNNTSGPLVTVDCKPGQSLDLEQLLNFQQNSNESRSTPTIEKGEISTQSSKILDVLDINELNEMDYDEVDEEDNIIDDDVEDETIKATKIEKDQENFERSIVEFLLENALSFTKVLLQSPSFGEVLRLYCSSSSNNYSTTNNPIIPSPEPLLTRLIPKMFIEALDERKAHFEEDFFVLILRRIKIENAPKGNTSILRISAVKLSENFGLCSRCLGVFAFCGGLRRLRDALRRCFEEGRIQLKLWQVSAVVHDGTPEFEELCRQLDLPGIISAPIMIRNIFSELDKLQFSSECVRRLKNRFEQTIGNVLDGMNFSAFSISVPLIIEKIDLFCNTQIVILKKGDEKEDNNNIKDEKEKQFIKIKEEKLLLEEKRLLEKFRTLWIFQKEKLLNEQTAKMSIFLNPINFNNNQNEQWKKIEKLIIEEICQACLPLKSKTEENNNNSENGGEEDNNNDLKQRIEIETEVNSYVEAALNEIKKIKSNLPQNELIENTQQQPQQQQSLSELLFWWRTNLEKFPRVGHLARQFCAIPLCVENNGGGGNVNWWKDEKIIKFLNNDLKNADYAAELLNTDLAGERDDYSADMLIVSQLLTVRTAVIEKNGCSNTASISALLSK